MAALALGLLLSCWPAVVAAQAGADPVAIRYSSLVSFMQVRDDQGVLGPPAQRAELGENIQKEHLLTATAEGRKIECPPLWQDVAYVLNEDGSRGARRVAIFGYGGCPFAIPSELEVRKSLEMREPLSIEIEDATANVFWLSPTSARPLANVGSRLATGCGTLVNVAWLFKKKGTRFTSGANTYLVERSGARIAFTKTGVVLDGVAKSPKP
jgi:hypothetical protein